MAFLGPSLRRKRVTDRPAVRAAVAALVSIVVNAALLAALAWAGAFDLAQVKPPERVQLAPLSAEQWNRNRAIAGKPPLLPPPAQAPPALPPPEAPPPPAPPEKPRGTVVDVTPGNDQKSDRAQFLAEHDNRVEKETRSRHAGTDLYRNRAAAPVEGGEPKKAPGKAGEAGSDAERQEAREARGGKGEPQRPSPEPPKAAPPAEEGDRLALLEKPQLPKVSPGERSTPGEGGTEGLGAPGPAQRAQEGKQKAGDPRLLPSVESMSRIARAGPSNDHLDRDIEEGEGTFLNTRAFRFASFFTRFKQDVSEHWQPMVIRTYVARDPSGAVYGNREWITGIHVTLDRDGAVKDIQIAAPSGLEFLDRVAVKAVRDASPFYNVPAGLLDGNGELAFDFGFYVDLGRGRGAPARPVYSP